MSIRRPTVSRLCGGQQDESSPLLAIGVGLSIASCSGEYGDRREENEWLEMRIIKVDCRGKKMESVVW